ncbi:RtcB family protein [Caulobacter mirabilis]|uniref:3'-phosphate/5'-hydroxy nucleic acid ligase n=1 Tax=Caulobacter mirabilis TaxID=69666 RepID=A0A2D2B024_9CAUL|nr:RtcB family protein [Caulobacter mirabilis]ATQ43608.1 RNA-splicing ligase RtcB [Caulobacter mirabilis]
MSGFEVIESPGAPIKAWTRGVPIEDAAMKQLRNVAGLPFIHQHVAVMPDVHWGMGATVGSVIPTVGAIIPAAVGVDIGCGMMAVRTSIRAEHLPDSLAGIRTAIEAAVPHGRTDNGGRNDKGAWQSEPPAVAAAKWAELEAGYKAVVDKHPKAAHPRGFGHLGTLGTGNHFVELCLDEAGDVWVMLHSGSRGVGNKFGTYFIERAKHDMRRWFINLPDQDLAYFPEGSDGFVDYIRAVSWAQKYARANREVMMDQVLDALRIWFPDLVATQEAVNCHHNYVTRERHFGKDVYLTRKGAVRAGDGELGIIPGSMGARSFIVRGKGNADSFCSCSHGAGRTMSRAEAKRRFTLDDHIAATAGVECRKDAGVIDETPMAYKDIDAVMAAQSNLVEVVHTLKQIVCVKG